MFFWNSLAFSVIQRMLAIWSLVPLPFPKPAWTSESSWLMYYWSLSWRILSITLLACEKSAIVLVWAFFGIAFLWDWNENCGHCWVFQICWHIECSTFTASSFRIWNSSTGIPSPPLATCLSSLQCDMNPLISTFWYDCSTCCMSSSLHPFCFFTRISWRCCQGLVKIHLN